MFLIWLWNYIFTQNYVYFLYSICYSKHRLGSTWIMFLLFFSRFYCTGDIHCTNVSRFIFRQTGWVYCFTTWINLQSSCFYTSGLGINSWKRDRLGGRLQQIEASWRCASSCSIHVPLLYVGQRALVHMHECRLCFDMRGDQSCLDERE